MAPATLTYFTCTLGQAAEQNRDRPHGFATVTEFIDTQALAHLDKPAVGFPIPTSDVTKDWDYNVFSFNDLKRDSIVVAKSLTGLVVENKISEEQKCVGLISPSSEDFLFAWLGLMRAGFSVLLIAPQCPPEAIAHLCKSCEVSTLFYDEVYRDLANSATKNSSSLVAFNFPWQNSRTLLLSIIQNHSLSLSYTPVHKATSQSVAYIHHTSGTSTGLPKPIPQTHCAAVGVLPRLDGLSAATFTTTPLYHGGIADCFRAWTSSAMIWLFPGGSVPITARNIVLSLSVTHQAAVKSTSIFPEVKYFSSVPYVLQILAEDKDGLKWLQKMDIVGVGGAALPESVGNDLVSQEVNLISRFGSAECGFLLSSQRDYSTDKDWQYLRASSNGAFLWFEKQKDGSGLSELVVLKGWPHMAKTNREDGSFATSDLLEPHPEIEGAWKYHSRSDSQITLITGKKFDPAPVEDAIVAAAGDVRDCLIFGNGRQVPGALVFLKENATMTVWEDVDRVRAAIEEVNKNGQDHTRITRDMIILKREGKLEKSSKGTVLRSAAEKTFANDIEAAYTQVDDEAVSNSNPGSKSTVEIVREVVIGVLGTTDLSNQDDLYQHGVDSASCMRIRNQLGKHFHVVGKPLPWNIVYDCGNIERLSEFLTSQNDGEMGNETGSKEMLELVDRYSMLRAPTTSHQNGIVPTSDGRIKGEVVLLTGATGSLGSHILSQLFTNPSVTRVYCLVRGKDTKAARAQMQRVLSVLKKRLLLSSSRLPGKELYFLPASLEEENLGCHAKFYEELRNNISRIIHAAWPVNFSLPLRAFEPSLRGLRNLLQLSHLSSRAVNFVFCSSTAAILGPNHPSVIPEVVSTSPDDADTLGYSKSKWVAEAICSRVVQSLDRKLKVKIMRIGQLTGDTQHGMWNMSEAYPLMLSTVREVGCLPKIQDKLSWLPLDVAARIICENALAEGESCLGSARVKSCELYHVVNNDTSISFVDLLGWLRIRREPFEIVEPAIWLEKLEKLDSHPAKALIGLWKRAYADDAKEGTNQTTVFETKNTVKVSQTMRNVHPVDERLIKKIWEWLERELAESR